ncbi:hypothetical protein [Pseudomonas sp. FG-3G]|nr:hypothetical protein [Pseudomonas sp. FG-3G]
MSCKRRADRNGSDVEVGGRCILIALFLETFFRDEVVIRVAKMSEAYELAFMLIDEEVLRSTLNPILKVFQRGVRVASAG